MPALYLSLHFCLYKGGNKDWSAKSKYQHDRYPILCITYAIIVTYKTLARGPTGTTKTLTAGSAERTGKTSYKLWDIQSSVRPCHNNAGEPGLFFMLGTGNIRRDVPRAAAVSSLNIDCINTHVYAIDTFFFTGIFFYSLFFLLFYFKTLPVIH